MIPLSDHRQSYAFADLTSFVIYLGWREAILFLCDQYEISCCTSSPLWELAIVSSDMLGPCSDKVVSFKKKYPDALQLMMGMF